MSDNEEQPNRRRGRHQGKRGGGGRRGNNRGRGGNNGGRGGFNGPNRGNRKKKCNSNYNNDYNRNSNFDRSNIDYNNYDNLQFSQNQIKNVYYKINDNNDNNDFKEDKNGNNSSNQKKEKIRFLNEKEIKEMEKKDIIDVISELSSDDKLCEKINGTNFKKETCYSFMNTIQKISEDNSEPVILIINKIIENTNFINKTVIDFLKEHEFNDENYLNFFYTFLIFLQKYMLISSKKLDNGINNTINDNKSLLEMSISEDKCNEDQKQLKKKIIDEIGIYQEKNKEILFHEYQREKQEKEENLKKKQKNKKNYKDIKTVINIDDFITEINYNIDPNLPKGEYDSYESYINTMFFLEYEDCYRNLRRAIYKLKNNDMNLEQLKPNDIKKFEKNQKDIYCYFNGEIVNVEINIEGVFIIIDFSSLFGKKLNFAKRMINGSLIVITNNTFNDYLLATVYYNPYIEKKLIEKTGDSRRKMKLEMFNIPKEPRYRIKLEVINLSNESFAFMLANKSNLQIFESKSYFQSYIHILNRLQNLVIKQLPFEKEIVKVNFDNLEIKDISAFIYDNILIKPNENIFPDSFKNNLDESQLEAIRHCLTSKIALVQGPPGTGKTHIGTIVTNIFRQNLKKNSKILVVCYTNHALDQFLENILNYNVPEDDIVRIGGRCKNENIKRLVLNNTEKFKNYKFRNIDNQIRLVGREMQDMIKLVQNSKESILNEMKNDYPEIYQKIIDDFFKILNLRKEDYIPKFDLPDNIIQQYQNYKGNDKTHKLNNIREEIIGDRIFNYWSNIGNPNFRFIDLIASIFENMDLNNKNEIYKASSEFKNCQYDDNKLLDKLKFFNNERNSEKKENNEEEDEEEEKENDNEESEEGSYIDNEDEILDRAYEAYNVYDDIFKEDKLYDDNDIFKKTFLNLGNEFSTEINNIELTQDKINYLLNSEEEINFFKIGQTLVQLIINYVKRKLLNNIFKKTQKKEFQNFTDIIKLKHELSILYDSQIIKEKQIVAMTTTGCAKYSTILEQLNFEVIIIEEAAEVLEPHILALLTKNTKRLIMLGDHKQLRPKPYSYEIGKRYNFEISMFERLINNDINFVCLKYQRRMKPLFSNFVRLIYGEKNYIDKVEQRENMKGFLSDFYIITHNKLEEEKEGLRSKYNEYEAIYIVKLCEYIIKQGYKSNQITILTFYVGQVMTIMSYLKKSFLKDKNIKVSSVDNYQGEENDIILLSLVRSNKEKVIGFLKNFNRVCVAFSRAKLGFYIIGNIDCIIEGIKLLKQNNEKNRHKYAKNSINNFYNEIIDEKMFDVWQNIKKKAEELNLIGNKLKLKCEKHGTITEIKDYKDFSECPEGGCQKKCGKRRKCGHICELLCHNYECEEKKCTKICNKPNPNCTMENEEDKHICKKLCCKPCGNCTEIRKIKLRCNHVIEAECYLANHQDQIKCNEPCERTLKCGHKCPLKCFEDCSTAFCKENVIRTLSCGHTVEVACGTKKYEILCPKKCTAELPCHHKCTGTCGTCLGGTLHVKCTKNCDKSLVCGHRCEQKCSAPCICFKQCPNKCPHGICGDLCCDICIDCAEHCEIKCEHRKCTNSCGQKCNVPPCNKRCKKIMKCKHRCMGLCGERCPNVCKICDPDNDCFQIFFGNEDAEDALFYKTECGHIFEYRDLDRYFQSQRNINLPVCPRCKSQLIWEPRYQNYIREQFSFIQGVKETYLKLNEGYNKQFYIRTLNLLNRIKSQYEENKIEIFDCLKLENGKNIFNNNNNINEIINIGRLINYKNDNLKMIIPTIYNLYQSLEKNKNKANINLKLICSYNLLTLAEKFMGIEYMEYVIKINEKNRKMQRDERKFMKNIFVIKKYFTKVGESFNHYFFEDLKRKIDNLLYYTILKLKPEISDNSPQIIDGIINSNFTQKNLDLKKLLSNYIKSQAIFIISNLGSFWYKCNKGHFYCSGNDEEGKIEPQYCPVCRFNGKKFSLQNKNVKNVDINKIIENNIDNQMNRNRILNQDQEVLDNMNNEDDYSDQEMDDDIILLLNDFPELNEYN